MPTSLVVYAKTDPEAGPRGITAFLDREGHARVLAPRRSSTSSACAAPTPCELVFEDCEVPAENVLGASRRRRHRADERPRLRARGARRRPARHHAGVHGRGAALRARAQAVRPADRRVPADAGQARRHVHDVDARARAYVYAVGAALRPRRRTDARRTRPARSSTRPRRRPGWRGEAIQALGGNGYINEFPTGRLWRDAKLYEIGAGTSEIRRMLIGRELFDETG